MHSSVYKKDRPKKKNYLLIPYASDPSYSELKKIIL